MSHIEKQSALDDVHSELINIFADLMDIRVSDDKSRNARKDALSACLRARKKMDNAGFKHSVAGRR